jgi:phosphatidate phosphatase APP1
MIIGLTIVSIIYKNETIVTKESYIRPRIGNLGIISDIDDTLVSYTPNHLKKLYHLLFRNVHSRKVFEDVVPHFQALSSSGRTNVGELNAFFFVSSEWNLYRFLVLFTEITNYPKLFYC